MRFFRGKAKVESRNMRENEERYPMSEKRVLESFSEKDTFEIACALAKQVQPGEIYCLSGDLGVGKTVFTKGFAAGIGITEPVSSPTFTIVQIYEEGRMPLYHFDVYRIEDIEEMEEIGYEDCFFGDGVCLIEWAELIKEILPDNCKKIRIEKDLSKGFDYRRIEMES